MWFAGILGCADSRVGPEYAFDTGRGDLFVCRVAGNFADIHSIASFEYAVAVLGTPLILVLGHSKCGAVDVAVKAVKDGKAFSGHIPSLIEAIRPAVKIAQDQFGDLLDNFTATRSTASSSPRRIGEAFISFLTTPNSPAVQW